MTQFGGRHIIDDFQGGTARPSTVLRSYNSAIRIHPDTPRIVSRKYSPDVLYFESVESPITETNAPRYERIDAAGRSESYLSYAGTDNQRIVMQIAFCASVEQVDNGAVDAAVRKSKWLQSLCYPTYLDNGIQYPPALIGLSFGKFLNVRAVVTQADPIYGDPFVGDASIEFPALVRMSLEVTTVNRTPKQASDFIPVQGAALDVPSNPIQVSNGGQFTPF